MINLENLKISVIILLAISGLFITIFSILTKKPFKTFFINVILSIIVWTIINFTAKFLGVRIPINPYTAIGCTVFGIPAIIGYLILPLIFI